MSGTPDADNAPGMRYGYQASLVAAGVPGLVHAGERWATSSWTVVPHRHEVIEVLMQLDGEPTDWRVDGAAVQLGRMQMLITPPHVEHELAAPPPSRWRYEFAAFNPDVLLADLPTSRAAWAAGMPVLVTEASMCRDPFAAFLREVNSAGTGRPDGLRAAAQHLAVTISRCVRNDLLTTPRRRDRAPHPALARAEALLRSRYDEPWTVPDLARSVGVSTSYLAALFTDEVGITPAAYLREIRCRHAEGLLVETDLTIADVATAVGFCSGQHLANVLRSTTGHTPSQVRANGRGDSPPGRTVRTLIAQSHRDRLATSS